ncbi:MAG TPA: RodZ domain-containing protein [Acidimicrobiales bacterium]|nr:RodZ domain-containing protein [Acidimicrobiales bacterium]
MIRPRGAVTRRRDDEEQGHLSAEEIGQLLRQAREEHSLDLLAVHDRISRPITQIEALERGDLSGFEDAESATSTLRRYATFLGLDGENLAAHFGRAWSAPPTAVKPSGRSAKTAVVAAPAGARGKTAVVPLDPGPDHLRAFTTTGEVPRFGVAPRPTTGNGAGPPTGTFPVLPRHDLRSSRRAVARARRRLRAPTWLKVVTWVTVVLVLVAVAGWSIRIWSPQWLIDAHVLRTTQPGVHVSTATVTTAPPVSHQKAAVLPVAATATGTGFVAASPDFTVTVATSGRCWVEITSSASQVPLLDGVQQANQVFSYKATGTMTVIVGASAVAVGVTVPGKQAYLNRPAVTPFTYTFAPPKTL